MFLQENKDAQISQMLDEVIKANESDFKRRLISALSKLDDNRFSCIFDFSCAYAIMPIGKKI